MKITAPSGELSSAIVDAARIAAGAANLEHSGVLIEHSPTYGVSVQAHNGHMSMRRTLEVTDFERHESEVPRWYIPGRLASRLFGRLPKGVPVRLEDKDGTLRVNCGKTRAKLHMIDPELFPRVYHYDVSESPEVTGFAQALKRVAFAAGKKGIIAGVLMDGKKLTATNSQILASVRCPLPLDSPVVLPVAEVAPLIKGTTVMRMGISNDTFVFEFDSTQIATTTLLDPYPKVDDYMALADKFDDAISSFDPGEMRMVLDRMVALGSDDKGIAWVRLRFTDDSIALGMNVEGVGEIIDEVSAQNSVVPPHTYVMALEYLRDVLGAWSHSTFPMRFCSTSNLKPFAADDQVDDYHVMWMPVRDPKVKNV